MNDNSTTRFVKFLSGANPAIRFDLGLYGCDYVSNFQLYFQKFMDNQSQLFYNMNDDLVKYCVMLNGKVVAYSLTLRDCVRYILQFENVEDFSIEMLRGKDGF